jgi:hypothetical protein
LLEQGRGCSRRAARMRGESITASLPPRRHQRLLHHASGILWREAVRGSLRLQTGEAAALLTLSLIVRRLPRL